MICIDCNLKFICKVFEMKNNVSSSINIVVNNCRLYTNNQTVTTAPQQPQEVAGPQIRSQETLLNMSDKIKEAARKLEVEKTPLEVADEAVERLMVECVDCGAKVFEAMAGTCGACGKIICEHCATHDMVTSKALCEDCWDNNTPSAKL